MVDGSRAEDGFEKTRRQLAQPGEEGELTWLEVRKKRWLSVAQA